MNHKIKGKGKMDIINSIFLVILMICIGIAYCLIESKSE